ncbi:hypothetical protein [Methylomonas sp. AM2-LC]|uniref:hypothetical protein n=1 Tax=Methylomonas sp. AM2-LC TaxID=3153301 RepID=UPI003266711F
MALKINLKDKKKGLNFYQAVSIIPTTLRNINFLINAICVLICLSVALGGIAFSLFDNFFDYDTLVVHSLNKVPILQNIVVMYKTNSFVYENFNARDSVMFLAIGLVVVVSLAGVTIDQILYYLNLPIRKASIRIEQKSRLEQNRQKIKAGYHREIGVDKHNS